MVAVAIPSKLGHHLDLKTSPIMSKIVVAMIVKIVRSKVEIGTCFNQ